MYFVLCLQQNREKIREEFKASFNSIGRKNSLAGQYSEVCFSVWLGFTCTMLRMLHNRSIFFIFVCFCFLHEWLGALTFTDDPNKKELLRITMSLREANKISQSLSKNIVSVLLHVWTLNQFQLTVESNLGSLSVLIFFLSRYDFGNSVSLLHSPSISFRICLSLIIVHHVLPHIFLSFLKFWDFLYTIADL